jgi:hypothetical protein
MNTKILKQALKEAEKELEAAKKRTDLDLAAAPYMRLKAEWRALEAKAAV